jgi:hypothetical protein
MKTEEYFTVLKDLDKVIKQEKEKNSEKESKEINDINDEVPFDLE